MNFYFDLTICIDLNKQCIYFRIKFKTVFYFKYLIS
jgi:hypothetical protein